MLVWWSKYREGMLWDVTVGGASGLCLFEKSDGRDNSFGTFIVKDFQTHLASPLNPDGPLSFVKDIIFRFDMYLMWHNRFLGLNKDKYLFCLSKHISSCLKILFPAHQPRKISQWNHFQLSNFNDVPLEPIPRRVGALDVPHLLRHLQLPLPGLIVKYYHLILEFIIRYYS